MWYFVVIALVSLYDSLQAGSANGLVQTLARSAYCDCTHRCSHLTIKTESSRVRFVCGTGTGIVYVRMLEDESSKLYSKNPAGVLTRFVYIHVYKLASCKDGCRECVHVETYSLCSECVVFFTSDNDSAQLGMLERRVSAQIVMLGLLKVR